MALAQSEPDLSPPTSSAGCGASWLFKLIYFLTWWPSWATSAPKFTLCSLTLGPAPYACASTAPPGVNRRSVHTTARMDGTVREENTEQVNLRLYINGEILQIYRQYSRAMMNKKTQMRVPIPDFISVWGTRILYREKKQRQDICHKAGQPGSRVGENFAIFSLGAMYCCLPRKT